MEITLNFRNKRSLCNQIQDGIKELITSGRLDPDDQLPTVRALATTLKINFNTVARAYRQLDREGWITTQQGRGTFVLAQAPAPEERDAETQSKCLNRLLDNFFTEADRLQIPGDLLENALARRFKKPGKTKAAHYRHPGKRKNNKSVYQLPRLAPWPMPSRQRRTIRKRHYKQILFHVKQAKDQT